MLPWSGRQGLAQGWVERAHTHGQYREEGLKRFPKPLVVTSLFFTSLQGSDFRLAIPGGEVVSPSVLPGLCQPPALSSCVQGGSDCPRVLRTLWKVHQWHGVNRFYKEDVTVLLFTCKNPSNKNLSGYCIPSGPAQGG